MSGRRSRELRQLSGYVKPSSSPTAVNDRSHTWRERISEEPDNRGRMRKVQQIRPTQLAVFRYGYKDLGWAAPSKYYTLAGKLRKGIAP